MNIKGIFVLSIALITAMIVLIGTCQACYECDVDKYNVVNVGTLEADKVFVIDLYTDQEPDLNWHQVTKTWYPLFVSKVVGEEADDYTEETLDTCKLFANKIYSNDINIFMPPPGGHGRGFMLYANLYPLAEPEPVAPAETSGDGMPKMCLRGMRSGTETARMELGLSFNYDLVEPGLWGDHPLYQRCYEKGYQKTMNILG